MNKERGYVLNFPDPEEYESSNKMPVAENPDVKDILLDVFAELKEKKETIPEDRYCEWYLGEMEKCDAVEKKVKFQCERMLKEVDARRLGLQHVCGDKFRERVDAAIEAGLRDKKGKLKKKSINYTTGTAGYRKGVDSIRFTDEEKAKEWAVETFGPKELSAAIGAIAKTTMIVAILMDLDDKHAIEAIKSLNKTPFFDHLKKTGEMPDGVELVPAVDKFYPVCKKLKLTEAEQAQLKGESGRSETEEILLETRREDKEAEQAYLQKTEAEQAQLKGESDARDTQ